VNLSWRSRCFGVYMGPVTMVLRQAVSMTLYDAVANSLLDDKIYTLHKPLRSLPMPCQQWACHLFL